MIHPLFIVSAAVAVYAWLDSKEKGTKNESGNDLKNGSIGDGGDRGGKQGTADPQYHGQGVSDKTGELINPEKTQEQKNDEQVSSNSEPVDAVRSGDSGNDCGGESSTPTKDGSGRVDADAAE